MGVESPTCMGQLFLKDNRILGLDEEQSLYLAKLIFFIPNHKKIKLKGEVFTLDDIDGDAYRKSKLPQQTGMGLNVATVDKRPNKTNQ